MTSTQHFSSCLFNFKPLIICITVLSEHRNTVTFVFLVTHVSLSYTIAVITPSAKSKQKLGQNFINSYDDVKIGEVCFKSRQRVGGIAFYGHSLPIGGTWVRCPGQTVTPPVISLQWEIAVDYVSLVHEGWWLEKHPNVKTALHHLSPQFHSDHPNRVGLVVLDSYSGWQTPYAVRCR